MLVTHTNIIESVELIKNRHNTVGINADIINT